MIEDLDEDLHYRMQVVKEDNLGPDIGFDKEPGQESDPEPELAPESRGPEVMQPSVPLSEPGLQPPSVPGTESEIDLEREPESMSLSEPQSMSELEPDSEQYQVTVQNQVTEPYQFSAENHPENFDQFITGDQVTGPCELNQKNSAGPDKYSDRHLAMFYQSTGGDQQLAGSVQTNTGEQYEDQGTEFKKEEETEKEQFIAQENEAETEPYQFEGGHMARPNRFFDSQLAQFYKS